MNFFHWVRTPPVLLFQICVAALALWLLPDVIRNIDSDERGLAVALATGAVLFDLLATSTVLTWWTRPKRRLDLKSVTGVFSCGLLLAGVCLPSVSARVFAVSMLEPLLLGVAVWVAFKMRRGLREVQGLVDPLLGLRERLAEVLPGPVAAFLSHEMLLWWSLKREATVLPAGATAITSFHRAGRTTYVWLYVFMELPVNFALHVALHQRGDSSLAWLLTAADTTVALYLLGLARSFERFPSFVLGDTFYLRQGLLWQAEIPLSQIEKVVSRYDDKALKLNLMVPPNMTLHLEMPVKVRGPWGIRRSRNRLTLFVDDQHALHDLLGHGR